MLTGAGQMKGDVGSALFGVTEETERETFTP